MSDQINYRRHGLVDSSHLTLAADFDLLDALGATVGGGTGRTGSEGHFPSLDGATTWLNSAPLTLVCRSNALPDQHLSNPPALG